MLHLAGRIALGVDVADLLELERALQRDGVVDAAAQEEEIAIVVKALGQVEVEGVVVASSTWPISRGR